MSTVVRDQYAGCAVDRVDGGGIDFAICAVVLEVRPVVGIVAAREERAVFLIHRNGVAGIAAGRRVRAFHSDVIRSGHGEQQGRGVGRIDILAFRVLQLRGRDGLQGLERIGRNVVLRGRNERINREFHRVGGADAEREFRRSLGREGQIVLRVAVADPAFRAAVGDQQTGCGVDRADGVGIDFTFRAVVLEVRPVVGIVAAGEEHALLLIQRDGVARAPAARRVGAFDADVIRSGVENQVFGRCGSRIAALRRGKRRCLQALERIGHNVVLRGRDQRIDREFCRVRGGEIERKRGRVIQREGQIVLRVAESDPAFRAGAVVRDQHAGFGVDRADGVGIDFTFRAVVLEVRPVVAVVPAQVIGGGRIDGDVISEITGSVDRGQTEVVGARFEQFPRRDGCARREGEGLKRLEGVGYSIVGAHGAVELVKCEFRGGAGGDGEGKFRRVVQVEFHIVDGVAFADFPFDFRFFLNPAESADFARRPIVLEVAPVVGRRDGIDAGGSGDREAEIFPGFRKRIGPGIADERAADFQLSDFVVAAVDGEGAREVVGSACQKIGPVGLSPGDGDGVERDAFKVGEVVDHRRGFVAFALGQVEVQRQGRSVCHRVVLLDPLPILVDVAGNRVGHFDFDPLVAGGGGRDRTAKIQGTVQNHAVFIDQERRAGMDVRVGQGRRRRARGFV